ncbi:L-threonylcarbamoyladenylate synthase [Thiolapillus sp.]
MHSPFQLRLAAETLRKGGVLAWPTEAIYGIGCDPLNAHAVQRLLALKQRPLTKGLILTGANYEQILPFIHPLPGEGMQQVLKSWPGPHTWLLPASPLAPFWITGGTGMVAVRVTAHPLARDLCLAFGGALTSTSANRSGHPPARTPLEVRLRCPGTHAILHGPTGGRRRPTPIRNALNGEVIRP